MIRVLTNILYNSIVELAILACVLLWLAGRVPSFTRNILQHRG